MEADESKMKTTASFVDEDDDAMVQCGPATCMHTVYKNYSFRT